ncbi:CheR family methyltransferase [Marinigracilibium pacificum]|uniref:protein-glutamate O-methyltransferase n=1 Tax=Marinigracilibium pacificum TaxID=2729599 RepID=A0A848IVY3_9BACT|nr:protein-glutamate O-methyltransferase CheR [Marinigracilibium pacificum]NMM47435.1 protein-glutamate O-methyltransferase CheR [Marinigracilibium pacificum]
MEVTNSRDISQEQFDKISAYLQNKYGLYFKQEKRTMFQSRLIKRLNNLKIDSFGEYLDYIFNKDKDEYTFFLDLVTTHKTSFFREEYQFDFLKEQLSVNDKLNKKLLKVWSAGCSTGEEVYTLSILLNEYKKDNPRFDFQILGTDISLLSLKKASQGIYKQNEITDLPPYFLESYFKEINSGDSTVYKFSNQEIKNKIKLGVLNLNRASYNLKGTFDVIFCRNVIIYFNAETQRKVLSRLLEKLNPGGFLFLGHSETAIGASLPIKSIRPTIYQKL